MSAADTAAWESIGAIVGFIHHKTMVRREEHEELLRVAVDLYRENTTLKEKLTALERLASSWTGTPERSVEIVEARKLLRAFRAGAKGTKT